jgi:hypothetical protein
MYNPVPKVKTVPVTEPVAPDPIAEVTDPVILL